MSRPAPLDSLESAVLARIARHRAERADRAALSAGTLVIFAALATGLFIGGMRGHDGPAAGGVESIVLADSARMAPAGLLAGAQ